MRMPLDSHQLAAILHQRREVSRLAAGGRAQIEHSLTGARREHPGHEHRAARLRHDRAVTEQLRPVRIERRGEHDRLRRVLRLDGAHGQPLQHLLHRAHQQVCPQRRLGRLVDAREQRACLLSAKLLPPAVREPLRNGVEDRRAHGRRVVELIEDLPSFARCTTQHGIDEWRTPPAVALGELHGFIDGGVLGHTIEEQQLVEAQPERRPDCRLEPCDGPGHELLGDVVERRTALHGPEREGRGQRAVAWLEPRGLRVEGAIGIRSLLEHPADHGE
jgi:hypothetical protein